MKINKLKSKKGLSAFEQIGIAIMVLIVILVAIVIFTTLTKKPSGAIGDISDTLEKNQKACKEDPANCNPLGIVKTRTPVYISYITKPIFRI